MALASVKFWLKKKKQFYLWLQAVHKHRTSLLFQWREDCPKVYVWQQMVLPPVSVSYQVLAKKSFDLFLQAVHQDIKSSILCQVNLEGYISGLYIL